jgi:putative Mg2+ transporter-C (MgtC) family protein
MTISLEEILKLVFAVLLGGAIGLERQLHHKAAGFRTITLICIGATLFTMLSIRIASAGGVAATIVTGIGFLGAGVILHETNRVTGLTTAATIWLSAAVGMGIGAGAYLLSLAATLIALFVVRLFSYFEHAVDMLWESRQYEISMPCKLQKVELLQGQLQSCGLKGHVSQKMKIEGHLVCTLNVSGSTRKHNCFVDLVLADPEIINIQW